jgi:chemotaxis protein methyltransferase CheR
MSELSCSPQVFSILSALIEERAGLSYSPDDLALFETKAGMRAAEAGFESMLDYYYFLRYDDVDRREFQALTEALLVHETSFFRELAPLEVAIDTQSAPRVAAGERPRIWCAACATGEEPVTLAILLAERGLLDSVELIASDLSERALKRAKSGSFGLRSLRQRPPAMATRYLQTHEKEVRADPALLSRIDYRRINLIEPAEVASVGGCDLILCRNVLIYFDDRRVKRVVTSLIDVMVPGGTLLVGVSESLLRFGASLRCEELRGVFLYRKDPP